MGLRLLQQLKQLFASGKNSPTAWRHRAATPQHVDLRIIGTAVLRQDFSGSHETRRGPRRQCSSILEFCGVEFKRRASVLQNLTQHTDRELRSRFAGHIQGVDMAQFRALLEPS